MQNNIIFATVIQLQKEMSKKEKLVARILSRPKDFTFSELASLLKIMDYDEVKTGKTSGSRRAFIHRNNGHIIRLHKPHPADELRLYQIDYIINELKKLNLL